MGPLERILSDPDTRLAFDVLTDRLAPADLRSLLLAIAEDRSARRTPAEVHHQYSTDRFCAPSSIDGVLVAQTEATGLAAVAEDFTAVEIAPLAPFGATSALTPVSQNVVVPTMRLSEVVSDPTNVLALQAASMRRSQRGEVARLSAVHRVTRAQHFAGPQSFAHFSLLGLVSAGRDRGDRAFETEEIVRHLKAHTAAIKAIDRRREIVVDVADHSGRYDEAHRVVEQVGSAPGVLASIDHDRTSGNGYYQHLCFKISVRFDDDLLEIGDGGSTDWTAQLLDDRKERLVISGLGLDLSLIHI